MADHPTPEPRHDDPPPGATDEGAEVVADDPVEPVTDETGEDLGEVSGGGEVTDLGGDSPSS
jgi:hypothetical protein